MLRLSNTNWEDDVLYVKNHILSCPEKYNTQRVYEQLEHPSGITLNKWGHMEWVAHKKISNEWINENLWKNCRVEDYANQVIQAPPVLMALCVGQYDLVKDLVEAGFPTIEIQSNPVLGKSNAAAKELTGRCVIAETIFRFTLGQFIMCDPDMPNDLRLYLWNRIAEEKKRFGKENGTRRGKVIDFTSFPLNWGINSVMFDRLEKDSGKCSETFLNTLKMIESKRPRYLKNIIGRDMQVLLRDNDMEFQMKLIFFLLEKVARTDEQRVRLLEFQNCFDDAFVDNAGWYKDSTEDIILFYRKVAKYYKENDTLKKSFFYTLLGEYLRWYDKVVMVFEQDVKKIELLLRKFLPEEFTLKTFLNFAQGYMKPSNADDKLCLFFQIYKRLTKKSLVLDWDFTQIEGGKTIFHNALANCIKSDSASWLECVDRFVFDDSKPLNSLQMHILENCGEDLLFLTLKRGLFRGKQIETALEYCISDEKLHHLVPCMIAFFKN